MFRVRTELSGWQGGPGLNTFYFGSPVYGASEAAACVARVHAFWFAAKVILPDPVKIQVSGQVDVIQATNGDTLDTLSVTQPAQQQGSHTDQLLAPTSVMALGRLVTGTFIAGRRVRGRTYIGPISQGTLGATGELGLTASGNLQSALVALLGTGPPQPLVVWHRPPVGTETGSICDVESVFVPQKLAVLRSRRD